MEWKAPANGQRVKVGPLSGGEEAEVFCVVEGPPDGQLVVCVCGINDWHYRWDFAVRALHGGGFRTLRYDHFNRGFSDTLPPSTAFDTAHYTDTLHAVLTKLGLASAPVVLMGHSMGGAVSMAFASRWPDLVAKLVLLAPAGFFASRPVGVKVMGFLSGHGLGGAVESLVRSGGEQAWKDDFHDIRGGEGKAMYEFCVERNRAMAHNCPHSITALVSSARFLEVMFDAHDVAAKVQANVERCPVLVVLGRFDKTTPFKAAHKRVPALLPGARCEVVDAAHCFHLECKERVHEVVLEFLGNAPQ